LPELQFEDEVTACGNVVMDAGNVGATYVWSTGSNGQTLDISQSGIYTVSVTNSHSCIERDTVDVTILPLPALELGPDLTLCYGKTTRLDAGNSTNQYVWADNFSATRYLVVGTTGTYAVTVIDDVGCASVDSVNVTVRPPLGLELGEDKLICSNDGIFLTAGVDNVTYQWGSATGFTSQAKEIRPSLPGAYWVSVEDNFKCFASDTIKVSATTETIEASFLIPSVVNKGDIVHFAQLTEPDPVWVQWDFGDGGFSAASDPSYSYFSTGDFTAKLIVSNGVCTDTLSKAIIVRDARFGPEPELLLPEFIDIVNATQFPNPTDGIVKVRLVLTTEADVWVCVISVKGNIVEQKRKRVLEDEFEFDLTSQSNGIYLVRIMVQNKMRILKVLKAGGY
jgi:hypothetical protein